MNTLSLPQLARSSSERADLHLHSHYSDGQYAPRVLAQMAAQKGLRVIALTDHATTRGIAEMIAEASRWGIYNLPAIELNAQTGDFLGYYIDYEHQGLLAFLQEMNALREKRIRLTVARLREFGYDLAWSALVEFSKPALPSRAHIARMLVALKRFPNVDLVFKTLLGRRQPAYIEPEAPSDEQCVRIIREAGGLAVLAHPQFLNVDPENLQPYIQQLVVWGVSGVEQIPERVRGPESAVWEQARKEHGLFEIQGSGFHGEEISNVCLGDKTIGVDFFSVMEASLPPQSAHKSFFKRLYWRSSNLSPAEFHQSLFPEDYHVITPHHTDLLDYQPEIPPVPADYVGLPFVLVTPGALDQIDEIRKILGAFGAQIVAEEHHLHYPQLAWTIYRMYQIPRIQKPQELLRFELDHHLYGARANVCHLIFFRNLQGAQLRRIKQHIRAAVGKIKFYRVSFQSYHDTFFTAHVHMPDEEDIQRECWIIQHLGKVLPSRLAHSTGEHFPHVSQMRLK